jgi:hypothetical protein
MSNTADVTGGKPIAVWLQSISGGDAVNPLVAFNDIHGRKRDVLFFCYVLKHTYKYVFIFEGVSDISLTLKNLKLTKRFMGNCRHMEIEAHFMC